MKLGSVNELPQYYVLAYEVDLMKDKKLFLYLNLFSLIFLIPLAVIYYVIVEFSSKDWFYETTSSNPPLSLFLFIVSMFLIIILHELIHGIFFKMASKEKLKFTINLLMASASIPNSYFYKKPYLRAGLAPAIILSLVLIVVLFFLDGYNFLLGYVVFSIHFMACIGDFFIAWKLRNYSDDSLILDYGMGMKFYQKIIE